MPSTSTIDKTALTAAYFAGILSTDYPTTTVETVDTETGEMHVIGLPMGTDPADVATLLRDAVADKVDPLRPSQSRGTKRYHLVSIEDHVVVIRPNAV